MANISGYLQTIKTANSGESVRDAIIKCMKDINEDSAIRATNLTITKDDNVTYTAPKGYAFKNVTVNIDSEGETDPNNTYTYEELSVTEGTENGTYPLEPRENFAYSKVIVNINWDAITGSIDREGTMNSLQTADDGRRYWDCNWDGHNAVQRVYIGEGVSVNLPDYTGSGTGQGSADGPFMVTFKKYDDKPILSKSGIPKGAYIFEEYPDLLEQLEKQIPKSINGRPYSGQWTYASSPIVANTTCKPMYNAATAVIGGDSLAKVMEDGGAHYAIGETVLMTNVKTVDLPEFRITGYADRVNQSGGQTAIFPQKTVQAGSFSFRMMLVAHGEGGTASTWLSIDNGMDVINSVYPNNIITYTNSDPAYTNPQMHCTSYGCDDIMGSISHQMIKVLLYNMLPEEVKSHVVQCQTKMQYGFESGGFDVNMVKNNANNYISKSWRTPGLVWVPSYAELGALSVTARTEHRAETNVWFDSDETSWTLDSNYGTVDYAANGWLPSGLETADGTREIYTRSTCVAHAANIPRSPFGISLAFTSASSGATIQDRCKLKFYPGDRAYPYYYFGFCTT